MYFSAFRLTSRLIYQVFRCSEPNRRSGVTAAAGGRQALGGQGTGPASPPTVRRRLYRKVWIIMTMIGKSGSKIVLELNHPRCKAAGQQEELEIRIQSA